MKNKEFQNWEVKKTKIQSQFPQLSSDDLMYKVGQEIELLKRLQEKLGKNKKEIRKWLSLMG